MASHTIESQRVVSASIAHRQNIISYDMKMKRRVMSIHIHRLLLMLHRIGEYRDDHLLELDCRSTTQQDDAIDG